MRSSLIKGRLKSFSGLKTVWLIILILQILLLVPSFHAPTARHEAVAENQSFVALSPFGNLFGMTSGDSNGPGSAVYLNMPAVIGGSNVDTSRPDTRAELLRFSHKFDFTYCDLRTTAAVISTEKATEFTLLGAKPSGTM